MKVRKLPGSSWISGKVRKLPGSSWISGKVCKLPGSSWIYVLFYGKFALRYVMKNMFFSDYVLSHYFPCT
ncbi:MAG: hypothetical protein II565_09620 [Fibrobacter sp.]|nr:hypothetical protein [Fibrobacter sp.]